MTREELAEWNVGTNLDQLMNLDPRGYGVCRILYEGARAFAGEPVSMHSAKAPCTGRHCLYHDRIYTPPA